MPKMSKPLALIALVTAAIATLASPIAAKAIQRPAAAQLAEQGVGRQQRGRVFAEAHCAACHAIEPNGSSPNPESPPFEAVANTRGLTAATLAQFLRDSHNYPGQMNFTIDRAKIDDLAAYIVTLKRADYRPAI
ncbi:MAG: hypothetical protein RIQ99_1422 [Pseudomonadota bacterium]|jgi:mono/diheme cytochrome c family protein